MDKPVEQLGAVIYYLDFDKDQWREGVRSLIPNGAIERNPHITILYGLDHSQIDLPKLSKIVHAATFNLALGEIGIFRNNTDIIYINVKSIDIEILNHTIRKTFPYANQYEQYIPHITLGFANPVTAEHLIGHHPDPQSLGLTQPLRGGFYYLTPEKKRLLI